MSTLYTSYKTSLRLKEAGAPQATGIGPVDVCPGCGPIHYIDEDGCCSTCGRDTAGADVRFFRADEIIEALGVNLLAIYRPITGPYEVSFEVVIDDDSRRMKPVEHDSLVEALAAAWLAVLGEAK